MMAAVYYNEIDPYASQWLRNLIAAGHIAPGDVDERSIEEVNPDDLRDYTQCHFFAGIGVWSYALRCAGWSDNRPVWTGSCPCQPFSAAGKGDGFDDQRHLWPAFHWLISQCRPERVFGEQVANGNANFWFDLVQADLEAMDYAFGCVPFPSAGVGAPHIRDRAYWVAHSHDNRQQPGTRTGCSSECTTTGDDIGRSCKISNLAYADHARLEGRLRMPECAPECIAGARGVADNRCAVNGFWRDADWLFCRDGKWRPVEPGTFPLAYGVTNRVGRLRAYGNAINAEAAKIFIESYLPLTQG